MPDIRKYVLFDLSDLPDDVYDQYCSRLVECGHGYGSYLIKIQVSEAKAIKKNPDRYKPWERELHKFLQEKYPGAYKGEYDLMFWGPDY